MDATKSTIRFEALLFIAGMAMLVGTFGPWEATAIAGVDALKSWHGGIAFFGGLLAIVAALVTYDFFGITFLEKQKPLVNSGLGILSGLLGLAGSLAFFGEIDPLAWPSWGIYLTLLASILVIVLSVLLFREGIGTAIPMGLSTRGAAPPEK